VKNRGKAKEKEAYAAGGPCGTAKKKGGAKGRKASHLRPYQVAEGRAEYLDYLKAAIRKGEAAEILWHAIKNTEEVRRREGPWQRYSRLEIVEARKIADDYETSAWEAWSKALDIFKTAHDTWNRNATWRAIQATSKNPTTREIIREIIQAARRTGKKKATS